MVLFVLAAGCGLFMSRGVWGRFREERSNAQQAQSEMRAVEREKADLVGQRAFLESEAGREQAARERRWLKPGEKPL
jgi:hypothetical protein